MPLREVTVRTVVLSPHCGSLVGRIPVLLAHALEERGEPEVVPVSVEGEAVHVAGILVTDDLTVARIVDGVLAAVDVAVAVQVLVLGVTQAGLVVLGGPDERVEILLARGLGAGLGGVDGRLVLPETVGDEAPELTHPHALVVVAGEGLVGVGGEGLLGVVVLVDDRVVVGQGGPDAIAERLAAEVKTILPGQADLETVGGKVGVVALG